MKYRLLFFVIGAVTLAGCTDNPDSIAREYRNAINECVDALAFISDEPSAKRMNLRVLAGMNERFEKIDKKLHILNVNRESKKAFVKSIYESNGVQLYLTELEINGQRYALELLRIRRIYEQYLDDELARADKNNEDPRAPQEVCPTLHDLVGEGGAKLDALTNQLTKPALVEMHINQFSSWDLPDYDKAHAKFVERRKKSFTPKEPIRLVN